MIITENPTIGGKDFTKKYSDKNVYIRQDQTGILYDEAIDPSEFGRTYTETDIPVEADSNPEPDLTVSDTLEMLSELGVKTDDK